MGFFTSLFASAKLSPTRLYDWQVPEYLPSMFFETEVCDWKKKYITLTAITKLAGVMAADVLEKYADSAGKDAIAAFKLQLYSNGSPAKCRVSIKQDADDMELFQRLIEAETQATVAMKRDLKKQIEG
jgi:hypothetical protein